MKMEVTFPDETTYGSSLGRLRKALKSHVRELSLRRRSTGVIISGSPENVTKAILLMPAGYKILPASDSP